MTNIPFSNETLAISRVDFFSSPDVSFCPSSEVASKDRIFQIS